MSSTAYIERRGELERYFDRTAVRAWEALTSTAPVSRIRASVRAGRDAMRNLLLSRLPYGLSGRRILDAGCGTGALAVELASRGAEVVAVDLSPTLVELAGRRTPNSLRDAITYRAGDMTDPLLGSFDHIVAMDSLIHYESADVIQVLSAWSDRTQSILFTFVPRTIPLAVMHRIGRRFPRSDRAPAISPVAERDLRTGLSTDSRLRNWRLAHLERVASGFYTSELVDLERA